MLHHVIEKFKYATPYSRKVSIRLYHVIACYTLEQKGWNEMLLSIFKMPNSHKSS
jgi:hypothetical protein